MPTYTCEIRKMTIEILRGHFARKWNEMQRADMDKPVSPQEWPEQRYLAVAYSKLDKRDSPGAFLYTLRSGEMLLGTIFMRQQDTESLQVTVQALLWASDLWFDEIVKWLETFNAPTREDPYKWAIARREEGMGYRAIFDGWAERYIAMYGEEKYYELKDPYESMTRHLRRTVKKQ